MALIINNRYAGDEAWEAWFNICSVAGCDAESSRKLREQVESAMYAQLTRYGFSSEDAPKTRTAWWRGRTGWSIAALLLLCGGIGGLWYKEGRRDAPVATAIDAECEVVEAVTEPPVEVKVDMPPPPQMCVATCKRKTQGGDGDTVALVSSPVVMRSMCGSRTPGAEYVYRRQNEPTDSRMPLLVQRGEKYAEAEENEFQNPTESPLSTFGLDVDTSSYTLMRSSLVDYRRLPSRDSVRIEEYVNYFKYDYSSDTAGTQRRQDDAPVAVVCELAACPWNTRHKLLRLGVQAKKVDEAKLPPCNLTFLVDVSGSMSGEDRIELLKTSLKMLVGKLRNEDHVAIVTYANYTQVRLPSVSGREKRAIGEVIDGLYASGGTAGGAGLQLAYEEAQKNFDKKANNRVILVTDGDFNIGISSPKELEEFISKKRDSGIFLTVFGIGRGNYMDENMKKLANAGNGNYAYLDSLLEAKKVMLNEFGGTMMTVAKDVKVQVEFNPSEVDGYRLLGYENRKLAARDFNDDKKDAGEIGAGHTMTAFYEIVPAGSGEMCTVKLRYKLPDADKSTLVEEAHKAADITLKEPSEDFRFASAVAEYALLLKGSKYKGNASFANLIERARDAKGEDREGYRAEFIRLAERAEMMLGRPAVKAKEETYHPDCYGDVKAEGTVMKALRALKAQQATDGSWGTNAVGDTAWVVRCYLAYGETPSSHEFGETVQKGAEFLIERVLAGQVARPDLPFVACALADAYGMTRNPQAHEAAEAVFARLAKEPLTDAFRTVVRREACRRYAWARATTAIDLCGEGKRLLKDWRQELPKGDDVAFACLGLIWEDGPTNALVRAALNRMRGWNLGERTAEVEWAATRCKRFAGMCAGAAPEDVAEWIRWNKAMKAEFRSRLAGGIRAECQSLLQLMVYSEPTRTLPHVPQTLPKKKSWEREVKVEVDL